MKFLDRFKVDGLSLLIEHFNAEIRAARHKFQTFGICISDGKYQELKVVLRVNLPNGRQSKPVSWFGPVLKLLWLLKSSR